MSGEPIITIVGGHLGKDPEVKFTASGTAVCSMSVAVTPRKKDGDKWVDGKTDWYRVNQWGKDGELTADTLKKGDKVIVTGRLTINEFVNKEQQEVTVPEITADGIAIMSKPVKMETKTDEGNPW